jgi:hypothetical protein
MIRLSGRKVGWALETFRERIKAFENVCGIWRREEMEIVVEHLDVPGEVTRLPLN